MERVTMRALEKDIRRRYQSAAEMGSALGYQDSANLPIPAIIPTKGRLTIIQGSRQGHHIVLSDQVQCLGRLELGSENRSISRQHAKIVPRGGSYWLEDVSTNGTWVDGRRIYGETPLRTGALIAIGDNVLKLEMA
jgi:pSer/pThr/pTyr-binding forkhead associated (FHA) protein